MKRALITGGCGFIGSNLAKRLVSDGWAVDIVDDMSNGHLNLLDGLEGKKRIIPCGPFALSYYKQLESGNIDRKNTTVIIQDDFACDSILKLVSFGYYDIIFHQAAIPRVSFSVEYPSVTTDINLLKTTQLFEACVGNVKRIVFASSSSVYGESDFLPTHESFLKRPKSPYAWQKSAIEDFSSLCWDLYKLDIVCLRYFNVFGPGQYGDSPYSTAISAWCHSIKNNIELRSDGDGTQSRDLCHVDNIVHANILAATRDKSFKGRTYNIGSGVKTTNNDILKYLNDRYDLKVKNAPWRAGDVMHTLADISRASEEFNYKPLVNLKDGLETTLKWWRINEKS